MLKDNLINGRGGRDDQLCRLVYEEKPAHVLDFSYVLFILFDCFHLCLFDINVYPQICMVLYRSPIVNMMSLRLQFCTFHLDYCAFVCVLILTEPPSEVLRALLQPCFSLGICPGARINKHRWKRKKTTNICPLLCSPLSEWPDH